MWHSWVKQAHEARLEADTQAAEVDAAQTHTACSHFSLRALHRALERWQYLGQVDELQYNLAIVSVDFWSNKELSAAWHRWGQCAFEGEADFSLQCGALMVWQLKRVSQFWLYWKGLAAAATRVQLAVSQSEPSSSAHHPGQMACGLMDITETSSTQAGGRMSVGEMRSFKQAGAAGASAGDVNLVNNEQAVTGLPQHQCMEDTDPVGGLDGSMLMDVLINFE